MLLPELRRRPDELVTIEDSSFADGHEPFDITVRELAEDNLDQLAHARQLTGRDCTPRLSSA